jgi:zinc D-Ala-D-Ala carboxypeptidase
MTTQITPNFTLEEFTLSQTASRMGIPNVPVGQDLENVYTTAERLEEVRTILGDKPILISSGYRCPEVNTACGGSSTSAHMYGLAADFTCPGFGDPYDICKAIEPYLAELQVDQLIYEYGDWVHLAIAGPGQAPRCECLTISENGTTAGIVA